MVNAFIEGYLYILSWPTQDTSMSELLEGFRCVLSRVHLLDFLLDHIVNRW